MEIRHAKELCKAMDDAQKRACLIQDELDDTLFIMADTNDEIVSLKIQMAAQQSKIKEQGDTIQKIKNAAVAAIVSALAISIMFLV